MNCGDVREGLWPPERPRLLGAEVERARHHVRHCPECARYFAMDRGGVLEIRHSLQSVRAPLRVRGRIYEALAQARQEGAAHDQGPSVVVRTQRLRGRLAVVTALIVVLAISAGLLGPNLSRENAPRAAAVDDLGSDAAFVEDYLRRAVGEDQLESADPEEIARFLRRELGVQSNLLKLAGLVPTRVEICLLEGRRGAMVVYRGSGRSVRHYLVPQAAEKRPPRVAREHGGLAVVTWSTDVLEEALVGEMPPGELLDLARSGITD